MNEALSAGSAGLEDAGKRGDGGKLELARGLLRGMEARAVLPVVPEGDGRVLPVVAPLAQLLPAGGLRRGSTVAVPPGPGATSLLFALVAEASAGGAWVGVVGCPELGLVAAAEAGIRLDRLALVPDPGGDLMAVTVALLDGMDVVAVAGADRVRAGDRQRLAARARQRGAVLVPLGPWPGADVELSCSQAQWEGLGAGFGRLRSRQVRVQRRGRGPGRSAQLQLPAPGGGVARLGGVRPAPVTQAAG